MRIILLLTSTLFLGACGFHMRGHNQNGSEYAFRSLYLKTSAETSFTTELRTNLELNKISLANSSAEADLVLDIVSQSTDKQIISLSGAGQVREFLLRYKVSLRAYDSKQNNWMNADDILLQRNLTYDDSQILAKEQEETMLFRDMQTDAVQQVMRRLSRAKPRAEDGGPAR